MQYTKNLNDLSSSFLCRSMPRTVSRVLCSKLFTSMLQRRNCNGEIQDHELSIENKQTEL